MMPPDIAAPVLDSASLNGLWGKFWDGSCAKSVLDGSADNKQQKPDSASTVKLAAKEMTGVDVVRLCSNDNFSKNNAAFN